MVCPPLPWVSTTTGAFITLNSELVKITPRAVSDQQDRLNQLPKGVLDPILDSVNNLSSVPWRVNKPLLDLAINLFRSNDNALKTTLDMPLDQESLDIPLMSENLKNSLDVNNKLSPSMKEEYTQHLKA